MPTYDDELLAAASRLLARLAGQRGKLPAARIRRSISTCYYAIFHFLLEEAGTALVGAHNDLRQRRRILARTFSHAGMKAALDKVKTANVDRSVADFLGQPASPSNPHAAPVFAQAVAGAFLDAQGKRHDADYDLNKPLSAADARHLHLRVKGAIAVWRSAASPADRDFKRALCLLMLLKGQLRAS